MTPDMIDDLYDALKADGVVEKSKDNFRNYMLAPGDEGVANRKALYEALKNHQIFAAADDVLEYDHDNPLYTLPNFIGTSHVCGNSQQARRRVGEHLRDRLLEEIAKIKAQ